MLKGNLSENWRRRVQRCDLYLTASGKIEEDEKVQCAILLHTIGEEALEHSDSLLVKILTRLPT